MPWPDGWWIVSPSSDLAVEQSRPITWFGNEYVLWRGLDGIPHLNSAYCPHMGAHLGYTSTVRKKQLVCNFHGWMFDSAGEHVRCTLGDRPTNKALSSVSLYEIGGMIFGWNRGEPTWSLETKPMDPEGWSELEFRSFLIDAPYWYLTSGSADVGHLANLHVDIVGSKYKNPPDVWGVSDDGLEFVTTIESDDYSNTLTNIGPGITTAFLRVGDIETYGIGSPIPLSENKTLMLFGCAGRIGAKENLYEAVWSLIKQDVAACRHMRVPPIRPTYTESDLVLRTFHKWLEGFYR